jgi:hypothetical protein
MRALSTYVPVSAQAASKADCHACHAGAQLMAILTTTDLMAEVN